MVRTLGSRQISRGGTKYRKTEERGTLMKLGTKFSWFACLVLVTLILSSCSGLRSTTGTGGSGGGTGGTGGGTGGTGGGTGGSTGPFTIGGSALGLQGTGLVLEDNGGDDLTITGTGTVAFTFKTTIASGGTYNVIIKTQPSRPPQT